MNLYLCTTKGNHNYYVIAEHPTQAKENIEKCLNDTDYHFSMEREIKEIKLLTKAIYIWGNKPFISDDNRLLLKELE